MTEKDRRAILSKLSSDEIEALMQTWRFWARPGQLGPGSEGAAIDRDDWTFWLLLAGRGFGKTRAGAEWSIERAREMPGSHGALVAPTTDDAKKVMLSAGLEETEGASGILAVSPPDFRPVYEPSKRILTWPNGTVATLYSAEEPDRLRGPQHHWGWVDEVAAWARCQDAWDQFLLGLRLGTDPRGCITTTPRPIKLVRELLKDDRTVVTRGTTHDNRANLAPAFYRNIVNRYEGTRIGRQEIYAEVLDDVPGALWRLALIEAARIREVQVKLLRVVVAIDPAVSKSETSNETGIVTVGVGMCDCRTKIPELHGFVLSDGSGKYSPNEWALEALARYKHHEADRIVAEINNGGDLVESNIRTHNQRVPYRAVRATRGKQIRAEPVAALYEQGKVHHVGSFPQLEDQLTMWDPSTGEDSPDRLDALVWGLTDLMVAGDPIPDYHGIRTGDRSRFRGADRDWSGY
jgi:phage terminase large subunit-like protein